MYNFTVWLCYRKCNFCHEQEAQLLQRDRVTLRVIEILLSHSRSFEITLLRRACASPY